jgi:hypothetical protein
MELLSSFHLSFECLAQSRPNSRDCSFVLFLCGDDRGFQIACIILFRSIDESSLRWSQHIHRISDYIGEAVHAIFDPNNTLCIWELIKFPNTTNTIHWSFGSRLSANLGISFVVTVSLRLWEGISFFFYILEITFLCVSL